jgi:autocrine motility factor receptor
MASLVICMELKRLFFDLKRRIRRHSNYLKVIDKMERRFPWANQEELDLTDKCAVCWEKLEKARRLPCSHVFHHHCLRSWLEQDTSCPTCRRSLQDEKEMSQRSINLNHFINNTNNNNINNNQNNGNNINNTNVNNTENQRRYVHRNLFHFNGSRYSRWLPNFSLEVTNNAAVFLPNLLNRENLSTERLNEMTQQISQLFPHIPINLIQNDLNQTHSVEITIENILENRLSSSANSSMNINNLINNNPENTNVANLLLNSSDESDDLSNDDDDDNESVDEANGDYQTGIGQVVNANNNNSTTTNQTDNLLGNNSNEQVSSSSNSSLSSRLRNRQQNSNLGVNDETNINTQTDSIISKYSPSTSLSESANNLMMKKRDLILNSKK